MNFGTLASFVGGYLHQDWDLEYSSPAEAAFAFGRTEPLELVLRALGEGAILRASRTDLEVDAWMAASGCYVVVPREIGTREWLQSILETIASGASER